MKLYFIPFACSLATRIAIEEAELDAEFVQVLPDGRLPDGRPFTAISPMGYVPAMETAGGLALTEGPAVLTYIADLAAEGVLAPAPYTEERYQMMRWLNFLSTELHKAVFVPLLSDKPPEGAKEWARGLAKKRLDLVSAHLDGAEYLLGSFSVAGPAVEFARRLCAACATYGCRILVGPETYESAMESVEARPIESFKTQGVRRRVEIYEILSPKHGLSTEREASRDHFWRGVIYYREGQWDRATEEFTKARLSGLPDPALDFYIRRVESSRRGDKLAEREQTELSSAF